MADENRTWRRQDESFCGRAARRGKRSDLNQRQYGQAEGIPLNVFGNWRSKFEAEPQPPGRKLLYRRQGSSPPFSPHLSRPFSPLLLSPGTYPSCAARPIEVRRD
jgi:hypothetical protein